MWGYFYNKNVHDYCHLAVKRFPVKFIFAVLKIIKLLFFADEFRNICRRFRRSKSSLEIRRHSRIRRRLRHRGFDRVERRRQSRRTNRHECRLRGFESLLEPKFQACKLF